MIAEHLKAIRVAIGEAIKTAIKNAVGTVVGKVTAVWLAITSAIKTAFRAVIRTTIHTPVGVVRDAAGKIGGKLPFGKPKAEEMPEPQRLDVPEPQRLDVREPELLDRPPMRGPAMLGLSTGIAFLAIFGIWAAVAPLEGAAVAPGTVQVEGNRKTVQHLEGGIVANLGVREGTTVKAGAVLVRLDDTLARTTVDQLTSQLRATIAQEARLIAERDEQAEVVFSDELIAETDEPSVVEMVLAQLRIFKMRKEAMEGQTQILRQRDSQAKEQINGLRSQVRSQKRQIALIGEEADAVKRLVKRGLEKKPRLLLLQRQMAEIEGRRAQNIAEIARIRQVIGENKLRVLDVRTQHLSEVVQELRQEQGRIYDLRERLRAAADVLERTVIRAPVSGKVVSLNLFTVGGVIEPREALMDIVPTGGSLVVEAKVSPADIDLVRPGLPVRLQFSAFNNWSTPPIDGIVMDISGDRLTDQRSGTGYYTARITADVAQLVEHDLTLLPGMPVEAMIVTGERTLVEYLLRPITDLMRRSLTED